MTASTTWRLHVASKTVGSCQRVVDRVSTTLGVETRLASLEQYWKIPTQHVVVFTTSLDGVDPADGVLQTLVMAGRLCANWTLSTPQIEDDGSWALELVAAADESGRGFSVPGIAWAHLLTGTRTTS